MRSRLGWALLAFAHVVLLAVLGLYQGPAAAEAPAGRPPFANAVEQRMEMIRELRAIRELLEEQNALLRSGETKVFITGVAD